MEELNNHLLWDSHTRILDKYTLRDKAPITDDQYKGAHRRLVSSVLYQTGLKHPIVSNTTNICELLKLEKLNSLGLRVLKTVVVIWILKQMALVMRGQNTSV